MNQTQPNIRRTFPGTSSHDVEDDDASGDDDNDYQQPVYRGGGKQLGKDDDDSDDDDDEPQYVAPRGAGKQFRGGGKYLRP